MSAMSLPMDVASNTVGTGVNASAAGPRGWAVDLSAKAQLRRKLPGWKGYVARKSHELREAVIGCHYQLIRPLLTDGAEVDFQDRQFHFRTPLHLASMSCGSELSTRTLVSLLDAGASVHRVDEFGNTPLHLAAATSSLENVQDLLEYGASTCNANKEGFSPLHVAAKGGEPGIVSTLLDAGSENERGECDKLPLELAIQAGNVAVVKQLLRVERELGAVHFTTISRELLEQYASADFLKPLIREVMEKQEAMPRTRDPSKEAIPRLRSRVSELFGKLSLPRTVILRRIPDLGGFGFRVDGGSEYNKLPTVQLDAAMAIDCVQGSLEQGDEISAINGVGVSSFTHAAVIDTIKKAGNEISLTLVASEKTAPLLRQRSSTVLLMEEKRQSVSSLREHLAEASIPVEEPAAAEPVAADDAPHKLYIHSVPVTTRPPRPGELHGFDYSFVTREQFKRLLDADRLSNWGEHNGFLYGSLVPYETAVTEFDHCHSAVNNLRLTTMKNGHLGFALVGGYEEGELPTVSSVNKGVCIISSTNGPLREGDAILAINGTSTAGKTLEQTTNAILHHKQNLSLLVMASKTGQPHKISELLRGKHADKDMSNILDMISNSVYSASVPYTTRAAEPNEIEGVDYHFVSTEEFVAAMKADEFFEAGKDGDVYYGIKKLPDRNTRRTHRQSMVEAMMQAPSAVPTLSTVTENQPPTADEPESGEAEDDEAATPTAGSIEGESPAEAAPAEAASVEEAAGAAVRTRTSTVFERPDRQTSQTSQASQASQASEGVAMVDVPAQVPEATAEKTAAEVGVIGSLGAITPEELYAAAMAASLNDQNAFETDSSSDEEADDGTQVLTLFGATVADTQDDDVLPVFKQKMYFKAAHEALEDRIEDLGGIDGDLIDDEYLTFASHGRQNPSRHSRNPVNKAKNRYSNVTAYDHSRVILDVLDGDEDNDYINANWVKDGFGKNKYIATQGPMPASLADFWRLIWQTKAHCVVMVTNEVERGKLKCHRYWPDPARDKGRATRKYGAITVTYHTCDDRLFYKLRQFKIKRDGEEERIVNQFAYIAWPDHGAPSHGHEILQFRADIHKMWRQETPLVVHCSAGVGRSGSFIAIDRVVNQAVETVLSSDADTLEELIDAPPILDVKEAVMDMRQSRNLMVQTAQQYHFVYISVLEAIDGIAKGKMPLLYGRPQTELLEVPEEDSSSEDDAMPQDAIRSTSAPPLRDSQGNAVEPVMDEITRPPTPPRPSRPKSSMSA